MNTKENSKDRPEGNGDQVFESLFSHAEARQRAPADVEQEIRESLHSQWAEMTQKRRRRKTGIAFAAAASVLLTVVIGTNLLRQPGAAPRAVQVAAVERQSGNVFFHDAGEPSADAQRLVGDSLFAGQVLVTEQEAQLAIDWPTGESVRMDQGSRIALVSPHRIDLLEGRLYLDSDPMLTGSELTVHTPAGAIRHLGTQYLANLDDSGLSVSVREGQVLVSNGTVETLASPGEQVRVDHDGASERTSIPTYGGIWAWTERVTPEYVLDGRSAHEFIQWVSRQTGRTTRFSTRSAEELAHATLLRGSISLEPMRALELILQTSDLVPEIQNGTIVIGERQET